MALNAPKSQSLRVLALHGHRQSGEIFAKKTGAMKKILTSLGVTFIHYPTAPHKIDGANEDGLPMYSWFQWEPEEKWDAPTKYTGVDATIAHLKQQFIEYGPFDGVLGFSQGGVVLSMLTGMRVPRAESTSYDSRSTNPIAFDFAIFAATFAPLVPDYFFYTMNSNKCAPLATLHVYGTSDPLVSHTMSQKLEQEFELQSLVPQTSSENNSAPNSDKRIYKTTVMRLEHTGGHFVATNAASKAVYKLFFNHIATEFPRESIP